MKTKKENISNSPKYKSWQGLKDPGEETSSNKMPPNNSFELPFAWRATCRV